MKKFNPVALILMLAILVLYSFGCGPKIEKYGDAPDESAARTEISNIMLEPQKYLDKAVVIEGVISTECPGGCWMKVSDKSAGTIYVEMLGCPFVPLPQRTGKNVLLKGVIYQNKGDNKEIRIAAKGLIIK